MPDIAVHLGTSIRAKQFVEIFERYFAVFINIQYLESNFNIFCITYSFPAYTSAHEFLKVYNSISVVITLVYDFRPINVVHFIQG